MKSIPFMLISVFILLSTSCIEGEKLAISSFGPVNEKTSKASPADVISMGRDDDDGLAKKWHIGGE